MATADGRWSIGARLPHQVAEPVSKTARLPTDFGYQEDPDMGALGIDRTSGRRCTDQVCRLDIRQMAREDLLRRGQVATFTWGPEQEVQCTVRLSITGYHADVSAQWRVSGEWHSAEYQLDIEWLPCRFGGVRPLWVCPVPSCASRAAIVYGRGVFACRRCMRLAYRSQREWMRA